MTTGVQRISLPAGSLPLPEPGVLAHVLACPIHQLIVAGRSGSVLIHAYLDGHPEILHVPHTFKYFDFVAANPDLLALDPATLGRRFVDSPLTAFMFDSSKSVLIGGRLGREMDIQIEVDRQRLVEVFVSVMAGAELTLRSVFCGLVAAYGWCIGQDPRRAKVILHHLHHGDWLYPELLIDRSNVPSGPAVDALAALRPSRIIQAMRNPYDTFRSSVSFARKHQLPEAEAVTTQELLVRLLAQDWHRWRVIQRTAGWCHTVRLEDLRQDPLAEMRRCATSLGVDPSAPSLGQLTLYGQVWMGDIFTAPAATIHAVAERGHVAWQDRAFLDRLLGRWIVEAGYEPSPASAVAGLLMRISAMRPSPTVLTAGDSTGRAATKARLEFAQVFSAAKRATGFES